MRKQYPAHVQKMFELLGEPKEAAARDAQTVLDIETGLAKVSLDRVERRDPANTDHKMTRKELAALAPGFDWDGYFTAIGAPGFHGAQRRLAGLLQGDEPAARRAQPRRLEDLSPLARPCTTPRPLLPAAFVNENFDFFDKTLTGAKELRPRWKRCVALTDQQLGEALGQRYVEATFGAEGKERMLEMVRGARGRPRPDIREPRLDDDATKKQALEKLPPIANKIGYPDKWRDYSDGEDRARRRPRQRRARHRVRDQRAAGQDRQAGRPRRSGA